MRKLFVLLCIACIAITTHAQNQELINKAEQGDAEAQAELADNYYYGWDGFEENYEEAYMWASKAAMQGNAQAQDTLGDCYYYGNGTDEDELQAEYWYLKSAEQGYDTAYFSLGLLYENTDKDKAIYWFKKRIDAEYAKTGKTHQFSVNHLKKLGVTYTPGKE